MFKHYTLVVLSILLIAVCTLAQVTTATISGTVSDSSGAVIPGAKITIRNVDTGISRTVMSDTGGRFSAPQLPIGNYETRVEAAGFQTVIRSGLELTVGREAVVNITVPVGTVSEQVTVTGDAPLVQTTSTEISSLVNSKTIEDLPLNGRNYVQLITLQPGVTQQTALHNDIVVGTGLKLSVAGGRVTANRFLLDGTDINDQADTTPGSAAGVSLGIDALREFEILTNNFPARYGRKSGGVINAVTKSGTNEIHGTAFEFLRNSHLDARNFFDRGGIPPFKRNQFGGAVGGPLRKDKTFFLGSYEGLRERLGLSILDTVFSQSVHNGFVGAQFIGVDNRVRPWLNSWPLPNGRDLGGGIAELFDNPAQPTRDDFFVIRLDHHFSDKDSLFVSYTFDDSSKLTPGVATLPQFSTTQGGRAQYITLEEVRFFSPRFSNVFHVGFNRSAQFWGKAGGAPVPGFSPSLEPGIISIPGLTPFGPQQFLPRIWFFDVFQYKDEATYSTGKNNLQFGFELYRYRDNGDHTNNPRGTMSFGNIAGFLQAQPLQFSGNFPGTDTLRNFRYWYSGLFVQDDVQLARNLTVNLGLRYEMTTRPDELHGKLSNLVDPLHDTQYTIGNLFNRNPTLLNFAPRVGIAWDPSGNGKTSIRAAYGIFYDQPISFFFNIVGARTEPFFGNGIIPNPPFPDVSTATVASGRRSPQSIATNIKDPTKMEWNLNVQRQVFANAILMVGYTGSTVRHLPWMQPANDAIPQVLPDGRRFYPVGAPFRNPAFSAMNREETSANSFYHGMVVSLKRRFRGLQVQAAYTLAKSIDDQREAQGFLDNGLLSSNGASGRFTDNAKSDRALSSFDTRHNFTLNYSYDLPGFQAQHGILKAVAAGWQIGGILSLLSGSPFTIQASGANFSRRNPVNLIDFPDVRPGRSNNPVLGIVSRWYDPTAFSVPTPGFQGNLGRNTVMGPAFHNFDLVFTKNTPLNSLSEKLNLQFRAEFFNLVNHPNFGLPRIVAFGAGGAILGNAGQITETRGTSRQIQFGLKLIF